VNYLTAEDVLAVLKVAHAQSVRDWTMILLAYRHGLRASEVCNLRLADVDMRSEAVTVRRLKGSMLTVQPLYRHKGQPLLDEVAALRNWFRQRNADGSEFVFLSGKGGSLHRSQFFRIFRACAAAAGLPPEKRHPHALKHSLASHLVAGNVNLALVRQCLGHKNIGSTMKYVGVSDSQASQAARAALMNLF
jgi:type 1 fimbriae regulatory protein FimB